MLRHCWLFWVVVGWGLYSTRLHYNSYCCRMNAGRSVGANMPFLFWVESHHYISMLQNGQTPLAIAQKLGYISVVDTLTPVTEVRDTLPASEDKYKVVSPETMQETFISDSEDEGGESYLVCLTVVKFIFSTVCPWTWNLCCGWCQLAILFMHLWICVSGVQPKSASVLLDVNHQVTLRLWQLRV